MGRKKEGFTEVPVYLPDDIYGPLGEALKKEGKTIGAWLAELAERTWKETLYVQTVRTTPETARTDARTDEPAIPAGDNSVRTAADEPVNNELTTTNPTFADTDSQDEALVLAQRLLEERRRASSPVPAPATIGQVTQGLVQKGAWGRTLCSYQDEKICPDGCKSGAATFIKGRPYCARCANLVEGGEAQGSHPELPPAPKLPECARCGSRRYLIRAQEGICVAERCDCVRNCTRCNNVGFFSYEWQQRRYSKDCDCKLRDNRLLLFKATHIPALYAPVLVGPLAPPANYTPTSEQLYAQSLTETWAKLYQPGARGILLHGPIGTSKTTMLCRVLRYLSLEKGIPCRFVEWSILYEQLKETYDEGSTLANPISPLRTTTVLAIDEVGKWPLTNDQSRVLSELISNRYNRKFTTLYSTNLHPTEKQEIRPANNRRSHSIETIPSLKERIGDALFDRVNERTEFVFVRGNSLRPVLALIKGGDQ